MLPVDPNSAERGGDQAQGPLEPRARWLAAGAGLGLIALTGAVYANALDNPFVFDDHHMVVGNPSLAPTASWGYVLTFQRFRPLVNLSNALDVALWGRGPLGPHLTNLVLHLTNVLLLFVLLRGPDAPGGAAHRRRPLAWAAFGAALFAVHPLLTQAVGYVSGRPILLCSAFVLGALLTFRRFAATGHRGWLTATALGCALAATSKEVGLLTPIALLGFDGLILAPRDPEATRARARRLFAPLLVVAVAVGAARLLMFAWGEGGGSFAAGIPTHLGVVLRYAALFFAPVGQGVVHSIPEVPSLLSPRALLPAAVLVGATALAWRARRRWRWVPLGLGWFLLFLAPSVLVPPPYRLQEQRAYLGAVGLVWVALEVLGAAAAAAERRRVPPALLAVVAAQGVVVLSLTTVLRNAVWGDPITLWGEVAARAPSGDGTPAPDPVYAAAFNNLGVALYRRHDLDHARAAFERALAFDPQSFDAWSNRGAIRHTQGDLAGALADYGRAIEIAPERPQAYTNRGLVLLDLGRPQDAIASFQRAVELNPNDTTAWCRQGLARASLNDVDGARSCFRAALRVAPGLPEAAAALQRLEGR